MSDSKQIYFARAGNTDRVKIGCATSVEKRVKKLQTGCPEPLRILLILPCGSRQLETHFHAQFQKSRVCGEWFEYEPDIKAFIQKRNESRRKLRDAEEAYNLRKEEEREDRRLEVEQERWLEKEQARCEQQQEDFYEEGLCLQE